MADGLDPADRSAVLALADRYRVATGAGDGDALATLMTPDATIWHNHDDRVVDVAATLRSLAWLHRTVDGLTWDDDVVTVTETGFVWRSVLTGTAPGGALRIHSCVVADVEDGAIVRIAEYLDSAALRVLRS